VFFQGTSPPLSLYHTTDGKAELSHFRVGSGHRYTDADRYCAPVAGYPLGSQTPLIPYHVRNCRGPLLLLIGLGEGFRSGQNKQLANLGRDIMFTFPGRIPAS
jgi:hypothetical protein